MGETADGVALFDRLWQEARVVSDPKGELFSAYGIGRASPLQLFGPKVWFNAAGALLGGSMAGRPGADPWMMPGVALVRGTRVLWRHRYRHIGDSPNWAELPRIWMQLGSDAS